MAYLLRHSLLLLALIPILLGVEASGLDLKLQYLFFDPVQNGFPWRDAIWFGVIAHDGMRLLMVLLAVLLLATFALSLTVPHVLTSVLSPYWRQPRVLGYLLAAMLLGPLLVSVLKHTTTRPCPWDLSLFGGNVPYHELLSEPLFTRTEPGMCFPGGHASAGFALLAFVPLLRDRQRTHAMLAALGFGLVMGWTQMMRGAHFLSHNLWTAWICWAAVVLCYVVVCPPLPSKEPDFADAKVRFDS
ncbi:MAG: phosphatase PAP2 family protein [Pseudomonadota bacterium]